MAAELKILQRFSQRLDQKKIIFLSSTHYLHYISHLLSLILITLTLKMIFSNCFILNINNLLVKTKFASDLCQKKISFFFHFFYEVTKPTEPLILLLSFFIYVTFKSWTQRNLELLFKLRLVPKLVLVIQLIRFTIQCILYGMLLIPESVCTDLMENLIFLFFTESLRK
jgi:hypothetical protein